MFKRSISHINFNRSRVLNNGNIVLIRNYATEKQDVVVIGGGPGGVYEHFHHHHDYCEIFYCFSLFIIFVLKCHIVVSFIRCCWRRWIVRKIHSTGYVAAIKAAQQGLKVSHATFLFVII